VNTHGHLHLVICLAPCSFFTGGRVASLYMYIGLTYGAQNLCLRIIVVSFRNQVVYVGNFFTYIFKLVCVSLCFSLFTSFFICIDIYIYIMGFTGIYICQEHEKYVYTCKKYSVCIV